MKCSSCKNEVDCSQCESIRLVYISAKVDNTYTNWWRGAKTGKRREQNGKLPSCLDIGDNGYMAFTFCVDCGQIQEYKSTV